MVQGVSEDLVEWFEKTANDYMDFEKKFLFQQIKYAYQKHGPEVEKQIFKYICRYVMNKVRPPKSIDGMEITYHPWEPLSRDWIEEKGHNRKYYFTGALQEYIFGKNAQYWYSKPEVRGDYKKGELTYLSMFRNGRKPFRAKDWGNGSFEGNPPEFEDKLKYNEYDEKGNPKRELFKPMEEFLLYKKLDKVIDNVLKRVMEGDYEDYRKFVPSAGKLE